ncbi:MAG: DNA translocase FtsK [Chloroflexota bacterium]
MTSKTTRLNLQADRIEMVLAHHKLPALVAGGIVTPRVVRFNLHVAPHIKLNKLAGLAEEIALALGAATVRIQRDGAMVQVEVPREDREPIALTPLCRQLGAVPAATAVLGLDANGQPLLLRLSSPSIAHVLIAGTTGSGKTALARSMLLSLARFNRPNDLRLVLIDPKGRGFDPLRELPHLLYPIVRETRDAIETLNKLVNHMERRDAENSDRPRVVIAIDELADLLQTGGKPIEQPLMRLVQRGRQAGFHVIAATQKPSSKVMSGVVKSNFPTRLVGKVASPEDARTAAGIGATGAEKLGGHGEFLLIAEGQVIRFQSAFASKDDISGLRGEMRALTRRVLVSAN